MRPLCAAALLAVVAVTGAAQEPGQNTGSAPESEPARHVRQAIEHGRYGVRVSAARMVVAAGEAAIAPLREYEKQHGRNRLPLTLVDSIASSENHDASTVALLSDWAEDFDFYWRAIATRGLADRVGTVPALASRKEWFRSCLKDPFHQMRIQGARGLHLLGDADDKALVQALLKDPDPRVPVPVAVFLLEQEDEVGVPLLQEASHWTDSWFGDPWGAREAQTARMALARLRPDLVKDGAAVESSASTGDPYVAGLEIRSCRHGDWFVRFTADGQMALGLRGARFAAPEEVMERLQNASSIEAKSVVVGNVVCDYLQSVAARAVQDMPVHRLKCAPGAATEGLVPYLQGLAQAMDALADLPPSATMPADHRHPGAGLRLRLTQFVPD